MAASVFIGGKAVTAAGPYVAHNKPSALIADVFEIAAELERQAIFDPIPRVQADIDMLRQLGRDMLEDDRAERFGVYAEPAVTA